MNWIVSAARFFPRVLGRLHMLPFARVKRWGVRLIIGDYYQWLLSLVRHDLKYKFQALYWGLWINRNSPHNVYNFRRYIHMLEKGLSHQDMKDTFGESYILETVQTLKDDRVQNILDYNTRMWGEAVLSAFFKTCAHSPKIAEAYSLFQSIGVQPSKPEWVPYAESTRPSLAVDYESLYRLALRRRSIRHFLPKEVQPEVVEKAMKVAALSPSACNRQAFKFLFFNEKELVREILQVPGGVYGYEMPSVVIVVGSYRGYFSERDINVPIIDSSLAVMSFLFALETLGLASVCINWPNLLETEQRIRELIDLEKDEFIVMMLGVGYASPEGKILYSAKRDVRELLLVNERIKKKLV